MPYKIYKSNQRLNGVQVSSVGYSYGHARQATADGPRIVRSAEPGDLQLVITEHLPADNLRLLEEDTLPDGFELKAVHYNLVNQPGQPPQEKDYYEETYRHCVVVGASTDHAAQTRSAAVKFPNKPDSRVV